MYSEKSFYHSLIWKELSENSVLFVVWKSVVWFGSNSMQVSVLFDLKSEKVSRVVGSNFLKV